MRGARKAVPHYASNHLREEGPAFSDPIEMGGVTYLPTDGFALGGTGPSEEKYEAALLFMRLGPMGLVASLPPEALRNLAVRLTAMADTIDRTAARAASEALARAAGKGAA